MKSLRIWMLAFSLFMLIKPIDLTLAGKSNGHLDIYWVDVEGGAATLIVTPVGESILIDSGNPGGRDSGRIHRVATEMAGLTQIDFLITTHFHLDHFGGAAELAQRMPINVVYDNGVPERSPDRHRIDPRFPLLIRPYKEMQVSERRVIKAGQRIPLKQREGGGSIQLICLGAKQNFVTAPLKEGPSVCAQDIPVKNEDLSDNANSVVMVLEFGDFRFFDAGDLTWNVEKSIVCPQNRIGLVDVYQVTHHGLDQSNHPAVIHSLQPTVSIMNNGVTKGCGPQTFKTLEATASLEAMYQVHKNLREDIEHNTSDDHIANLKKECEGHPIHLSVQPDGGRYTVSLPGTGHARTFLTRKK